MHSTIVVGIDGTEDGLRAVDYAAVEAQATSSHLLLVHVVALTPTSMPLPTSSEDVLRRAGERAVEIALARALSAGMEPVDVRVRIVSGPVSTTLISATKQASLMVLGRRGLSGLDRVFAGSSSTGVSARAACPVVVVPHAWSLGRPYARVVVGVDGSARSLPALALAVAEASSRSAELLVVHAWQPPIPYYVDAAEIQDVVDSCRQTAELAVCETLAGWSEQHPDITITKVFETRHPVEALVAHSAQADLVVIGTRGGGGIPGLALGSVARAVVAGSCSPVLLVRRGPRTLAGVERSRQQHRHPRLDVVAPSF
jgi:nucleotide-binding universal stress UspA family protein